jgi:CheY-like chemotaxis protein
VRRRLLLADDSVTIQRVIELTFSRQDVDVITVSDGDQAIARIPIEKPDIVLADLGMPGRSGYEVCAFVKERPELAHIPVLLLAGAFEPVDEARVRQVRCDGVLVKPFEPPQVVARVRDLLGEAAAPTPAESTSTVAPPPLVQPPAPGAGAEPALARPEIGVPSAASPDRSLDQYFDRLDATFASFGGRGSVPPAGLSASELLSVPSTPMPAPPEEEAFVVPTIDELLGGALRNAAADASAQPRVMLPAIEPPEAPAAIAPAPAAARDDATGSPPPVGGSGNTIADTFNALFAVERGEADPSALRLTPSSARMEVTDQLVDEVSRRVLERLAPDAARAVVADVVSEIAERLVRSEIERIRNQR